MHLVYSATCLHSLASHILGWTSITENLTPHVVVMVSTLPVGSRKVRGGYRYSTSPGKAERNCSDAPRSRKDAVVSLKRSRSCAASE